LLLPLALRWGERSGAGLSRALEVITSAPARLLTAADAGTGIGRLVEGGVADLCIFDPSIEWQVQPGELRSQGKHTPFAGYPMQGRARHTLVAGRVVHG
jgi:dihydroorotase